MLTRRTYPGKPPPRTARCGLAISKDALGIRRPTGHLFRPRCLSETTRIRNNPNSSPLETLWFPDTVATAPMAALKLTALRIVDVRRLEPLSVNDCAAHEALSSSKTRRPNGRADPICGVRGTSDWHTPVLHIREAFAKVTGDFSDKDSTDIPHLVIR